MITMLCKTTGKKNQRNATCRTAATCWAVLLSNLFFYKEVPELMTLHSWLEFYFLLQKLILLCSSSESISHANPKKILSILQTWTLCGEYSGMKCHVFNITPNFSKNCQSYKDRELWRALKTSETTWKGAATLEDFVGKKKGHWVKVSWEVCNQENLPIKGTPSEHNVLSDYFIRKSIYNCFLLLWTENDRSAKALNWGGYADCGSPHSLKD